MTNVDVGARTIELNKGGVRDPWPRLHRTKSKTSNKTVVKVTDNVPITIEDDIGHRSGSDRLFRRGELWTRRVPKQSVEFAWFDTAFNPLEAIKNVKAKDSRAFAPGLPT